MIKSKKDLEQSVNELSKILLDKNVELNEKNIEIRRHELRIKYLEEQLEKNTDTIACCLANMVHQDNYIKNCSEVLIHYRTHTLADIATQSEARRNSRNSSTALFLAE